ncbi:hypothetical protein ABID22_000334 [Pontibacter aydingkolensis]|uniref:DUF262 domain-containing protein n=1 Tax=Pontibacter aydingkolensis TaxID=1911536 RepID=A0ABS7CQ87_9BACT|nr:DUF262 domain-containing protein [Pontibacter aydingkolensis]MBW7466001.1 DUF262 domain-containing protein [Pontibacter aydingkolensis]
MSNQSIKTLSIKELFDADQYLIPVYQRNYAWEAKEINQLIQDIADYAVHYPNTNYYIGTLVIYKRVSNGSTLYETIDGQQRLTTLNILLNVLKREFREELVGLLHKSALNLAFESRPLATETLQAIAADTDIIPYQESHAYTPAIRIAYSIAKTGLEKISNEVGLSIDGFYEYLMNRVLILRVGVPHDTDLNHYFEIMNNRGEQLEKHEILKARLLQKIQKDKSASYAFNKVWEACSDMERYVQYGFDTNQRDALFLAGNWDTLQASDFIELKALLSHTGSEDEKSSQNDIDLKGWSIDEIIAADTIREDGGKKAGEAPERFTSVISFPNFLLHVLRLQTKQSVPLDDKRLLDIFDDYLEEHEKGPVDFVHEFGYNLLKARYLFDKYVLKREVFNEQERWSLKRLKRPQSNSVSYVNTFGVEEAQDGENKNLIMLLAMFHVSAPTQVYKHWLNAVLKFVFERESFEVADYLSFLKDLARRYLFNRYLKQVPDDYYQIIYKGVVLPERNKLNEERLNKGTAVENFIFNYLDYLLWNNKSKGYQDFEFTFSNSVEHYYPQKPLGNIDRLEEGLDEFGNLCLISSSKNSKLSNNLPAAKKDYYYKVGPDSLKQQLMMDFDNWGTEEIREHGNKMKQILFNELCI